METRIPDDEVHDLPGMKTQAKDNLEGIFELQQRFMDQIGIPTLPETVVSKIEIDDFVRMLTSYSQTCAIAVSCETTELLDALPWKPWKKSYKEIDLNNVHIEIIDILMFVIELAIIWGLDAKTLFALYSKKMQENFDRQARGY
jgi:dimeric dUTPase (all-alpha-NTP-PPase superfamily)